MRYVDFDTRLAAYVVVRDADDRVLLGWFVGNRYDGPGWALPGGGVHFEETVEQAAVRETREETGYDVALDGLLLVDTWQVRREPRPFKTARVVFRGHVVGGSLGTLKTDDSTSHAAWVDPGTLEDPTPLLRRALAAG